MYEITDHKYMQCIDRTSAFSASSRLMHHYKYANKYESETDVNDIEQM